MPVFSSTEGQQTVRVMLIIYFFGPGQGDSHSREMTTQCKFCRSSQAPFLLFTKTNKNR